MGFHKINSKSLLSSLSAVANPTAVFWLIAVFLPVSFVLVFFYLSVESERLASVKKLELLYQRDVENTVAEFSRLWESKLEYLDTLYSEQEEMAYIDIIADELISSALLWDQNNEALIPHPSHKQFGLIKRHPLWLKAQSLEFQQQQYLQALNLYKEISKHTQWYESNLAVLAQARILNKLGKNDGAITAYLNVAKGSATLADVHAVGRDPRLDAISRIVESGAALTDDSIKSIIHDLLLDAVALSSTYQYRALLQTLADVGFDLNSRDLKQVITAVSLFEKIELKHDRGAWLEEDLGALLDTYVVINTETKGLTLFVKKDDIAKQIEALFLEKQPDFTGGIGITQGINSESDNSEFLFETYMPPPLEKISLKLFSEEKGMWGPNRSHQLTRYLVLVSTLVFVILVSSIFVFWRMRRQERLSELKNDMLATVSHELRTPLSSVRILIDNLISDDSVKDKKLREYIQIISDENERLTRLVNNFLAFSRIDRQRYGLDYLHFSSDELVQRVMKASNLMLNQPCIDFKLEDNDISIELYGDIDKLEVVLLNLIENAIKYSSGDKIIRLRLELTPDWLLVHVQDNGIGLRPQEYEKIFSQFYRVEQVLNRSTEGCGLGLYISAYIAKQHGGAIDLTSKFGGGSTFTLRLPRE